MGKFTIPFQLVPVHQDLIGNGLITFPFSPDAQPNVNQDLSQTPGEGFFPFIPDWSGLHGKGLKTLLYSAYYPPNVRQLPRSIWLKSLQWYTGITHTSNIHTPI